MDGYYTYKEFLKKVDDYDGGYLDTKSYEGREIPYIKLSNTNGLANRKSILLVGGLNASPIALSQLFWNIDQLIAEINRGNTSLDGLLKTNHIYIIPMLNVDGYKYLSDNWDDITDLGSTETTRQKNRNHEGCPDGTYGVDLSRNFEYQWGVDDSGSSPDPCHENYRGSSAFSEPETRALRDFAETLDVSLYMSYGTGQHHYVMPYSYSNIEDYIGPRGWFYHFTGQKIDWKYTFGNIQQLTGQLENGVDIDYFENTVGAAALQALLKEVNFNLDFEVEDSPILVDNYAMFKQIVLRTSNTFTTTSAVEPVTECSVDCAPNSVGNIKFVVTLIYEDFVDSDPIYVKFFMENPVNDYKLWFKGIGSTKLTHQLYQYHTPEQHAVTVDDSNIEFTLELGSIEAETSLILEIDIEYSKDSALPEPRFVDYEFYVGFDEDNNVDELVDIIYKKFDKVALKHDVWAHDPIDPEQDDDKDDKDDGHSHHSHGLNEEEKVAVGVSVTLIFLAIVGFVLWWVCIRGKGGQDQSHQFSQGPQFEGNIQVPEVPAYDLDQAPETNMYTDPGNIHLQQAGAKQQSFSIE